MSNTMFDNLTPAQINQMPIIPDENTPEHIAQEAGAPEIPQQTMADLPALEVEAQPEQENVPQALPTPKASAEVQESPQQMRFREVREAKLRAEWERDEALRQLQAMQQQRMQPQAVEEDDDLGINPDDVIEGKHLAKAIKKIEQRYERKAIQQQQQMMQTMMENRLKMELPDLDDVVSTENLAVLRTQYPELAASINANPDLYSKAKSAYTLMKKLGIAPQSQQEYNYAADKQRIAINMAKPKPVQSLTQRQSALAQANSYDGVLTEDMKKTLWKDMQKSINSY